MRRLSAATGRLLARADTFEPRGMTLAVARSLLAVATLSVLAFTPQQGLFVYTPQNPSGVRCAGVRGIALWCLGGAGQTAMTVKLVIAVLVLAAVAVGLSPRWTCLPHWYVTFSLGTTMTLPNGGDSVARIATMLVIPMCLADDRLWQWRRPAVPLPPAWRGSSYAAHLFIRVQVAIVYLLACGAKVALPGWRDGSFMYQVLHDPYYGPPPLLRSLLGPVFDAPAAVAVLGWATIVVECAVAVCMLGGRRVRRVALLLAVALHGGIIVLLGLFSFGLTMIALVALAGAAAGTGPAPMPGGCGTEAEPVTTRG
jgi:antimicrobial peptide system SdpB family protein